MHDGTGPLASSSSPIKAGSSRRKRFGTIVCCDLLDMDAVRGATFVRGDFLQDDIRREVRSPEP